MMNPTQAMDKMYRYQRHIYDLTRKYYLFGRDTLIKRMNINPDEKVLEVGCGTARNLRLLAEKYPKIAFYGLDASQAMLDTAYSKLSPAQQKQVTLRHCLAEEVHYKKTFGLDEPFDKIFYSYALSMMPSWKQAIQAGLVSLKDKGEIHIVDFSDQRGLPHWFRFLLVRWLRLFDVHFRPELIVYLQELHDQGQIELEVEGIGGHYAFLAKIHKKSA